MNRNLMIITGLVVAAAIGFFAARQWNNGAFYTKYDLCMHNCNKAHDQTIRDIYSIYDQCMSIAEEARDRGLEICTRPEKIDVFLNCLAHVQKDYNEAISECRKTRDNALAAEATTFSGCKAECKKLIPSEFKLADD